MNVEATAVTIGLDSEESLRVARGTSLDIFCLSGVVWITLEGDLRDLFLAPGESMLLERRGMVLITALEPAALKIRNHAASAAALQPTISTWSDRTSRGIGGLWGRLRSGAASKLRASRVS